MEKLLSPRQVAQALGASESSLKRWCDQGLLPTVRTAGGHRKMTLPGVVQFVRQRGAPLLRPELLGLPKISVPSVNGEKSVSAVRDALTAGHASAVREILFETYFKGWPICRISDEIIAKVFESIGDDWACGQTEVYQERRACEIIARVLTELSLLVPESSEAALSAFGGSLTDDHYELPNMMAELVLREAGWKAQSLGTGLPLATFTSAISSLKPKIVWLSLSATTDVNSLESVAAISAAAVKAGSNLVVGGRAWTDNLKRQMPNVMYCDNMKALDDLARRLIAH